VNDLDNTPMEWNTAAAREALVNAPLPHFDFTFGTYPREVPPDVLIWAEGAAHDGARRGLVLHGAPGSGKTGLGVCALFRLASAGVGSMFHWNMVTAPGVRETVKSGEEKQRPSPVWFERWPRLLARHRGARWDEDEWFEQLEGVTVLMLDDVGVDAGTPYRESFLLRHVEWAEDRADRALVLTLNDPPEEWDTALGQRVADRLVEPRRFLTVRVPGGSAR
jgi:DNA replication protein DnaC